MRTGVFISHASQDKAIAKRICDGLEQAGVPCWIAPRDIVPGAVYAEALIEGVDQCGAMVVVFSGHTNAAGPVISEVDAASNRHKRIITFRIEDIRPTGALEFYLSKVHWLDAFEGQLDTHIERLVALLRPESHETAKAQRGRTSPPSEQNRTVQVFFHNARIERTSILATRIADYFENLGWSVTRGYTELAIHARGVWVHGSTDEERRFAIQILAQMGIEASVDDRAEEVPLQIIVGYGEHERRTSTQDRPTIGSDRRRQVEWSTDKSGFSSVPRLAVRLRLVDNAGGTPGLNVKAISDERETIEGAEVSVTDIRRWSDQHKTFVMSRDIYDSGTIFRPLEIGKVTLHPGEAESVGFIRCDDQRVEFNGKMAEQGQAHYRIRTPGIWQVSFRVQAADGRNQDGVLCFRWEGAEGPGISATPWDCPQPE